MPKTARHFFLTKVLETSYPISLQPVIYGIVLQLTTEVRADLEMKQSKYVVCNASTIS